MRNYIFEFWSDFEYIIGSNYLKKLSDGFEKFYNIVFESHLDVVNTFDLLFLFSFIIVFLAFLVTSAVAIFEQDQREIKSKVKFSSAAIANLAAAFWAIRETKFKSISYEGYTRIIQNKRSIASLQKIANKVDCALIPTECKNYTKAIKKNRHSIKNDNISIHHRRPSLPKTGKDAIIQSKKIIGLFNTGGRNIKCLRNTPSSGSMSFKQASLNIKKSQYNISSIKGACAAKQVRKMVHIDDSVKVY